MLTFFTEYSNDIRLKEVIKDSPLIVVAEITKIEDSPRIWSKGNYFVGQQVAYKIKEVTQQYLRQLSSRNSNFRLMDAP
jgi:hypothetical protein